MKQVIWLCLILFVGQVFATPVLPSNPTLSSGQYTTKPLITQLNSPWSLKVDDTGRYWITEKQGTLVIAESDNQKQRVDLALPDLYAAGQGGLLDLILLEQVPALNDATRAGKAVQEQQSILVSYAKGTAAANALTIVNIHLQKQAGQWQVVTQKEIFQVSPQKSSPVHYAGRMLLLPDNTLLVNSGDGFDWREDAQKLTSLLGKTLRISLTGEVPYDNPFARAEDPLQPYIYTYGHRNAQGLALDPQGIIWQHEHGPAGGDEINILEPGVNYGWPVITYGKDYSGAQITPFTQYPNMRQPKVNWTPSIAPSALRYQPKNTLYPELGHSLLVSSLKFRRLHSVQLPTSGQELPENDDIIIDMDFNERIRDISHHIDGYILLLTDGENAKIMQLLPLK